MLIASGKSSSVGCCKEQAHPPFQEDWGMCLRRQWPTHPSQAIPLWGVGLYPPTPLQRGALVAPQARRLGYRAVARTALPLERKRHQAALREAAPGRARPRQKTLGRGRTWLSALSRERLCHSPGERRCNDAAALSLTTRLGFRAGVRMALPLKRRCGRKLRYAMPC